MRMCTAHWDRLRDAIKIRGLWSYVSGSGEEAVTRMDDDPLMAAHNAIIANTLNLAGVAAMMPNEDGSERCPLCYLQQACECGDPGCAANFERWIEHAADDQLERCAPPAKA